jgi:hypothetical protein
MSKVACSDSVEQCSRSASEAVQHEFAHLELVIKGQVYRAESTHTELIDEYRSWRLCEAIGTVHIVTQDLDGRAACTCTAFVGRDRSEFRCDHILALQAVGLLDGKDGVR